MKRKLKPLHVILAENPDYEFLGYGIAMDVGLIAFEMFRYLGKKEPKHDKEFNRWTWHESWFEEIKEPERKYLYIIEDNEGDICINTFFLNNEHGLSDIANVERLTLDHIENGYVPIKERDNGN